MVSQPALEFSGNWYFDLGILGFVNILEEFWGSGCIFDENFYLKENAEIVKKKWLCAYLYKKLQEKRQERFIRELMETKEAKKVKKRGLEEKVSSLNSPNVKDKRKYEKTKSDLEKLEKELSELSELIEELQTEFPKRFEFIKKITEWKLTIEQICIHFAKTLSTFESERASKLKHYLPSTEKFKLYDSNAKLPIADNFFRNYEIYNSPGDLFESFEKLLNNQIKDDLLDKTLNKFMESTNQMPNAYYAKQSIDSLPEELRKSAFFCCSLLSFPYAFNWFLGKHRSFYSNDLRFTLRVNRKLRLMIDKMKKGNSNTIWEGIADTLNELTSIWALNSMQIIEYEKIEEQKLFSVEYLPLTELKAHILFDEKLRVALTQTNLLWYFLEDKNLIDSVILELLKPEYKKTPGKFNYPACVAAAIDMKLKERRFVSFGSPFKNRKKDKLTYLNLATEILEFKNNLHYYTSLLNQILYKEDSSHNLFWRFFEKIKLNNRESFLNLLFRELLKVPSSENKERLVKFISKEILFCELWNPIAFSLIMPKR